MRQRTQQRRYRFSLPGLRMLYTCVITTDKEIMAATDDRRVRQQIQRRMQLFKLLQRRQSVINDPSFADDLLPGCNATVSFIKPPQGKFGS